MTTITTMLTALDSGMSNFSVGVPNFPQSLKSSDVAVVLLHEVCNLELLGQQLKMCCTSVDVFTLTTSSEHRDILGQENKLLMLIDTNNNYRLAIRKKSF